MTRPLFALAAVALLLPASASSAPAAPPVHALAANTATDMNAPTPAVADNRRGSTTIRVVGTIAGTVVDRRTLSPLASVQVFVVGTDRGALTQANGRFVIPGVPAGTHEVRVERIGYEAASQEVRVVDGETTTADFEIVEQALALDEIVVTGTAGQARRREVGNSISQIDLTDVAEPAVSVDGLLQARAPGVVVNMGSSTMGAGAAIRLRGNVSVSQSNQPLVYVDGIRQTADAYPRNVSEGGAFYVGSNSQASPLDDINPEDIARVEIIKGAAATTLYGTEAAAGVIQIFTKSGASGEPTWTYQFDNDVSWLTEYGSEQRPFVGMEPWLRTGYGQEHHLSVTGGNEIGNYYLSGGYLDRAGVLPRDHEDRRRIRGKVTFDAADNLTFDWSAYYTTHEFETSPVGNNGDGLFFNVYRAPNNFVGSGEEAEIDKLLDMETSQVNDRLMLGLTSRWLPMSNFSHRITVGYDRAATRQRIVHPFGYVVQPDGDISDVRWTSETYTADYVGSLDLDLIGELSSTLSFGGQLVQTEESRLDGYGRGLPGPGEHTVSSAAESVVSQEGFRVNTGGFFAQGLFKLRDRYFLTLGLRVDGNSAFGEDFGLQPYPKASASYVISDEAFWNDAWGNVKLRAAYGFAGRAPGAFDAVRTWSAVSYEGQTAFSPQNIGNPDLGPERTGELELGFDGSFLNDRLSADFTYYKQKTTDALFPVAQPATLGFAGSQLENVGRLTNEGVELALNATVLDRRELVWDVGASVATNQSEVTETGSSSSYTLVVGQPAPVVRGAKVVNADAFEDPVYEFDAFFGPNQPTHTIGVNTSLRLPWGLLVSARGDYQGGHWLSDFPSRLVAQRGPRGALGCDAVYEHVPWGEYEGPGDTHANLDQVRALDRARCYSDTRSDVWFMPADFFKLREVTAQIPVPFQIPGATSARFTASIRNIWRWTNDDFASFDPEIISSRSQVSALSFGISDQLPPPTSATFSLRVTF